jgi:hypothetical protein
MKVAFLLNITNLLFLSVLYFSQIKHIMTSTYKKFHNFISLNYLVIDFTRFYT